MTDLYCDGGVIAANPSTIGGTWAFCIVRDGMRSVQLSGYLPAGPQPVTNNLTEMLALVRGLQALPDGWAGTIYSDSQITLGRAFDGWKWKNIPPWLHDEYKAARVRLNWPQIKHVLLQGHPTRAELLAGVGKSGRPVSEHNVWCDQACGLAAEEYLARLSANERKRAQADDIAQALAEGVDVEFDEADVRSMSDPIIFSYLENLGYEWTGREWVQIGNLP
jgi:ribonuclease HI